MELADYPDEHETKPLTLSTLRRLLGLAVPYRWQLAAAGLLTLAATGLSLALPPLAEGALDRVFRGRDVADFDRLVLGLLGLALLGALLSFGQYLLMAWAGNRIVADLRDRLFGHLLRLPLTFFDRNRTGDLVSRLSTDVTLLQQTLAEDLIRFTSSAVTLVGGIVLAVVIDWRLCGVVVGLLFLLVGFLLLCGLRLRPLSRATLEALADAAAAMGEALAGIRVVRAFARERHEQARVAVRLEALLDAALRASRFEAAVSSIASVGFLGVLLGVIWYGGRGVMTGQLTPGTIVAFLMSVALIGGPLATLAEIYSRLQRAAGAADRLFALEDTAAEPPDSPDALPFPAGAAEVSFSSVAFQYAEDTPVLRGLTMTLPAGQVTALAGASGAGKSTAAALLCRFYDAGTGDIRIDGVPLERIRRQELREAIGVVPQEPVLFAGTIRENIRYGRLAATDAEVEEAAAAAHVLEFSSRLPQGLDTPVGDRGAALSGGQRQRVAIARALLKDPRLLVLDEATSALDPHSERLVQQALAHLMRGRTTLLIAHRESTLEAADRIVALREGRAVESRSIEAVS